MFRVASAFTLSAAPAATRPGRPGRPRTCGEGPPGRVPRKPTTGSYCIRAEAAIEGGPSGSSGSSGPIAAVRGYGDTLDIATQVKEACDRLVAGVVLPPGCACQEPRVVILTNMNASFVCDGVFMEYGDERLKLV